LPRFLAEGVEVVSTSLAGLRFARPFFTGTFASFVSCYRGLHQSLSLSVPVSARSGVRVTMIYH